MKNSLIYTIPRTVSALIAFALSAVPLSELGAQQIAVDELLITSQPLANSPQVVGNPQGTDGLEAPVSQASDGPPQDSESLTTGSTDSAADASSFLKLLAQETKLLGSREGTASTIKGVLLLGALSLAPAILLMTTCYVRLIVVLSLLRQAFGVQQMPPTQVLTALAVFITFLVMMPVWNEVKREAIDPYSQTQSISWEDAWARGIIPVKRFMARQIQIAKNENSIALFYKYLPECDRENIPKSCQDVPLTVLLPAFIITELKVAFLLGFQICLPFLVVDLVVSTVTVSMGMLMMPPTVVSFPLKLILFVLVDGWNLVVGMMLQSMAPFT
jgi:flagellar biosynthetic protein FliP